MGLTYRRNRQAVSSCQFLDGLRADMLYAAVNAVADDLHGTAAAIVDPATGKHAPVFVRCVGNDACRRRRTGRTRSRGCSRRGWDWGWRIERNDRAGGVHAAGLAALRCTDFYGPGVAVSHLGASAFGEQVKGKPAQLLVPANTPHDFAYVPDIARAAVALLDADDADFGQVWNMPCAPTRTPRELLAMGAATLGKRLQVWAVPLALLRPLGLFYRFAAEVADVGFTWDRPYTVDGSKFSRRFRFTPTPFETGVAATVRAFAGQR